MFGVKNLRGAGKLPPNARRQMPVAVKGVRNSATRLATRAVKLEAEGLEAGRTYVDISSTSLKVRYVQRMFGPMKVIGTGTTGIAFGVRAGSSLAKAWVTFSRRARNVIRGAPLMLTGAPLVLKVTYRPDNDTVKSHVEVAVREAKIQAALMEKKGRLAGKEVRGADLVPTIYGAGMDPTTGAYFILMGMAEGKSLDAVIAAQGGALTAAQYCSIEAAFMSLWALGWCHGDAHRGNVFLSSSGRCTFVDLGHALAMPPDTRAAMLAEAQRNPGVLAAGLFRKLYQPTVNSIMFGRGYHRWYNSDGQLLLHLFGLVPSERWKDIVRLKLRRRLSPPS